MGGGELMFTRTSQAFAGAPRYENNDPLFYGRNDPVEGLVASAPKFLRATFRVSGEGEALINHVSLGFRADEPAVVDTATPYETFAEIALNDNGVVAINTNKGGAGASGAPVNDVAWVLGEDIELMAMLGVARLSENAEWTVRFFVNGTEVFATNLPYTFLDLLEDPPVPSFGPLLGFIQVDGLESVVQTRYIEFGDAGILNDPH